jgi:hypothetical protein
MQAFDYEFALAKRLGFDREKDKDKVDIIINEYRRYNESIQRLVSDPEKLRDERRGHLSLLGSIAGFEHTCGSCGKPANRSVGFAPERMGVAKMSVCQECILLAVHTLLVYDDSNRGRRLLAESRYERAHDPDKDPHWDELDEKRRAELTLNHAGEAEPEDAFRVIRNTSIQHVVKGVDAVGALTLCHHEPHGEVLKNVDEAVLLSFRPGSTPWFCVSCRSDYLEARRIPLRHGS